MFAQGIKQLVKKKLEYTLSSLRHFGEKKSIGEHSKHSKRILSS